MDLPLLPIIDYSCCLMHANVDAELGELPFFTDCGKVCI